MPVGRHFSSVCRQPSHSLCYCRCRAVSASLSLGMRFRRLSYQKTTVLRRGWPTAKSAHCREISMIRFFASALIILTMGAATATYPQDKPITVFAAASLKNALDDVDAAFTKQTGVKVITSYDASSALMKQIEGGAPADAFVSADLKWMDYGVEKKVIHESTRLNLLGNVLVLIAAKDSKIDHVDIKPGFDLAKLAGDGRIATGDVKAVPVGLYAKAAAALAHCARREALLSIVYATDAKIEPGVKVVGVFPDNSHDPIIYPVAATVNAKPGTIQYLAFLRSAAAISIFQGYGFSALAKPTS